MKFSTLTTLEKKHNQPKTHRILIVSRKTVAVVQMTMKEKMTVQIGSACL